MSATIKNVAIVGATGGIGSHITRALLASPHAFNITAITRASSTATFPSGLTVKKVPSYSSVEDVTSALKDQEALIITQPFTAPQSDQLGLIDAAAQAGVQYVIHNEFGSDPTSKISEVPAVAGKKVFRERVESKGVSKWIGTVNNPWFDFSLSGGHFGIDIKNRAANLYDQGEQKIDTTTQATVGKAVAALLALPRTGPKPSLDAYSNSFVYISGLHVSQMDMLKSLQKATGTKESDWKIESRPVSKAVADGKDKVMAGDFSGMVDWLYGMNFTPGAGGDYSVTKGDDMKALGVDKDDLDTAVKQVLQQV